MKLEVLKQELRSHVRHEFEYFFGLTTESWIKYATNYFWDEAQQDFRLNDLKLHGVFPGPNKVLDLAAGCGQFLFRALGQGYDCHGIEPEQWKLSFIRSKVKIIGYPNDWSERVVAGVGENMPYADSSFDCITSYQTLEHVQDPARVISEMLRVTKPGGIILIRCPDYRGTHEGHYRLPWLPMMSRAVAKIYLRLLGKPTRGLDTIQYVTKSKIIQWLTQAEHAQGCRLALFDPDFVAFANGLRRRKIPVSPLIGYPLYQTGKYMVGMFRRETDVNIAVRILQKPR